MRLPLSHLRSATVSRAAMIAVATLGLGACSNDVGRFGSDPIYTGSTPNQRYILNSSGSEGGPWGAHAYATQPGEGRAPSRNWSNVDTTGSIDTGSADVARRDLVPPAQGPYADTVARPLADATRPAEAAPEYPRVAAANGWTPIGGSTVAVRPGETVDTLANRYGVPATAIRQANNWAPGRNPVAGERVLIPVYSAAQPTAAAPAPAAVAPRAPVAVAPRAPVVAQPQPVAAPRVQVQPQAAAPRPMVQPQPIAPQSAAKPGLAQPPRPLMVPTTTGSVPTTPRVAVAPPPAPPSSASAPASGGVKLVGAYTVRPGDSLASIARTYGVSEQALRERNNLKSATLTPGQQILLPAGTKLMLKTSQAPAATPPAAGAKPTAPVAVAAVTPQPGKPTAAAPTTPQGKTAAAKPTAKEIDQKAAETIAVAREPAVGADDDKGGASGTFRWPVRGRVISEFGAKPNGEKNEGINLAVPEGTSVKAADEGEVIYSGNELKGYGNLVLVRHSNGFVSAYAHASELLVNRGDKVTRGQIIARAGATGSVSQPQLHFELRKGQKAVDPKPYLASN